MKIYGYIQLHSFFKNREIMLVIIWEIMIMTGDHCSHKAKLLHTALQLFCRLIPVAERKIGKEVEPSGIRGSFLRHFIIDITAERYGKLRLHRCGHAAGVADDLC